MQTGPADSVPGSELSVYLLTFDPGDLVWERFGHNAIRIIDHRTGADIAYDYGRFDFGRTWQEQVGFVARFARKDLRYSMGEADGLRTLAAYQRLGRSIWSQELDLDPAAKLAMYDFLRWNIRDEHRHYDYDYYLDNCSTRLRDVIDRAVGGQLKAWADSLRTDRTYRFHTRRTTENSVATYTALMFGLGQSVDRPLSAWQEMFLPIVLRPYLNQLVVRDAAGQLRPLVKAEQHLVTTTPYSVAEVPSSWREGYLLAGLIGLAVLVGLGLAGRRRGWARYGFGALATLWSYLAGIGGLVLAGLWAFTAHTVSHQNENVLQLSLLSMALALVLPAAVWRSGTRHRLALRLAALVVLLSIAGLVLKLLPAFNQGNLDLIGLVLPLHLGLLAGLAAAGPQPTT
ncbi:MAG: lipoprotein N-acyltransferase Lnb domain-containing protein [Gemmatimonadales bacterium]